MLDEAARKSNFFPFFTPAGVPGKGKSAEAPSVGRQPKGFWAIWTQDFNSPLILHLALLIKAKKHPVLFNAQFIVTA